MDPFKQSESTDIGTDAINPVNAQGEELENTYQAPVSSPLPAAPSEPAFTEPAPVMSESFSSPVSETAPSAPLEPPVVTSTVPTEATTPSAAVAPAVAKSRLWLWLTLVVVVLALAAVLVFVYVLQ